MKAIRTYHRTELFCDEPGCALLAAAPCVLCGKDLCAEHRRPAFNIGNWSTPVCSSCRQKTIQELINAVEQGEVGIKWKDWTLRFRASQEENDE